MEFWATTGFWTGLAGLASIGVAVTASVHAILYKRDNRATVAWVGLIWLLPVVGAVLYGLLGINRIRRRAFARREGLTRRQGEVTAAYADAEQENLERFVPPALRPLSRLSDRVSRQPLLAGNAMRPLVNGDQAYPEMLAAIRQARHSITLSTYIFYNDPVGREFAEALGAAVARGVAVRVLIDAVGLRYSMPTIEGVLRSRSVPMRKFMPTHRPRVVPFFNLRNHRKSLVIDGEVAFFGGMNIGEGNCLERAPPHPMRDLHFRLEGPAVAEIQAVFAEDWTFASAEHLSGERWFPPQSRPGASLARVIADGPDERFDTLRQLISGALSVARSRISIVTPYFLPDATLQDGLCTAALRGVEVRILLPGKNNLPIVDWACRGQLEPLLRQGCRVFFSEGVFDHSKLFTVDEEWSLVGSTNWDPRSLSLNFEANVECYDHWLAAELDQWFEQRLQESRELHLAELLATPWGQQLRNGVARLFSPYL